MECIGKKIMYKCNITGNNFNLNPENRTREGGIAYGFNSRERAIIHCLTNKLKLDCNFFIESPENKSIKGIGMSDSINIEQLLSQKFSYNNTFFHQEPRLDIYNNKHILKYQNLDFIICSEVFEHISPYPSLSIAFDNLHRMLKKDGILVFSVPYNLDNHKEHFPSLYEYKIEKKNNANILINQTINGDQEIFHDLIFHDGDGEILEMRQFSFNSINKYLINANFINIEYHNINEKMNSYGIFWESECSFIITANK